MLKGKSAWTHLVWKLPLIAGFIGTCHSWLQRKFLRARCGPEKLHPTHARPVLACLCEEKSSYSVHKNPLREGYLDLPTNRKRMPSQAMQFSVLLLPCAAVLPLHLIARETLFLWQMLLWRWNCLCGTSLPCQKIRFGWLFSGWLAWEGGDSNHLCAC